MSADPLATFRLDGKVALVTGGNGGLGQAIARGLRAVGAEVLVTGRDAAKNREAADDHGAANVLAMDVRDATAVSAAVDHVYGTLGGVDIYPMAFHFPNALPPSNFPTNNQWYPAVGYSVDGPAVEPADFSGSGSNTGRMQACGEALAFASQPNRSQCPQYSQAPSVTPSGFL